MTYLACFQIGRTTTFLHLLALLSRMLTTSVYSHLIPTIARHLLVASYNQKFLPQDKNTNGHTNSIPKRSPTAVILYLKVTAFLSVRRAGTGLLQQIVIPGDILRISSAVT